MTVISVHDLQVVLEDIVDVNKLNVRVTPFAPLRLLKSMLVHDRLIRSKFVLKDKEDRGKNLSRLLIRADAPSQEGLTLKAKLSQAELFVLLVDLRRLVEEGVDAAVLVHEVEELFVALIHDDSLLEHKHQLLQRLQLVLQQQHGVYPLHHGSRRGHGASCRLVQRVLSLLPVLSQQRRHLRLLRDQRWAARARGGGGRMFVQLCGRDDCDLVFL
mmetsp:Transcript_34319/g.107563  ORF Transcript_34319/g.107563 Transcript_34319/m.107563 type:complete len:215 (-) Transcript_34319:624-1268(-)